MNDLKINMMDLIDLTGSMYNAVEFLIEICKKYKSKWAVNNSKNEFPLNPNIRYHEIYDRYNIHPGDSGAIGGYYSYSYGFLKTRPDDFLSFTFYDVDEEVDDIIDKIKLKNIEKERKKEEMKLKHIDDNPFGEENWLDERLITKYEKFLNEKYEDKIPIGTTVICDKGNQDGFEVGDFVGVVVTRSDGVNGKLNGIQKSGFSYDINFHNRIGGIYYHWWVFEELVKPLDTTELEKIKKKKEELRIKHLEIDPYGEENWDNENLMFEALTNPLVGDEPFIYSNYYSDNVIGFKNDILNDLKEKLIGKTIYIQGKREYHWRSNERDPIDNIIINGKLIKPYYRITVKDIVLSGARRDDVFYVNIISNEDKTYSFRKIISKLTYDRWEKRVAKEIEKAEEEKRRKERLKLKHLYHDPYGEENWDEDD